MAAIAVRDARIQSTNDIQIKKADDNQIIATISNAFVTLGVVMGGFLLCWLPFFTWYLTVTICGDLCPCPHIIVALLFWIGNFSKLTLSIENFMFYEKIFSNKNDHHCRLFQLHAESDNLRDDKPGVQGCLHQHSLPPSLLPEEPLER